MILRRSQGELKLHVAIDVGAGPPVVLLHGVASSSVTFANVVPLIQQNHRCIAIDLLGFGGSPIPENCDYTIGDHAAAVERAIRNLHLKTPFVLVGHSMGSLIAARLAARTRLSIEKVVLVSPPIYLSPEELSDKLDRGVMDFYLRAYKYVRENKEFTLRHAAIVERFLSIPKAMDINDRTWTPFVKSLKNSIESQTTISDLASITVPVDVIYGSLDEFHSEGVLKIVSRLSGVRTHRILGSDHLIGKRLAKATASAIEGTVVD
ncbi:alpha/beta hydrolase [Subtercola sp. PAMC28395]|uniref:alpha/beta fold hydrolase n=1 Tax=Subtercola sp. PAMC28395 TaxID=2846775 RepID=UPI001C0C20D5|nr:alpha/beta hydrolase [Subtercola sp. PAMC28395]QWT23596.1 alpha/beta hydrolase [Subtercola sp. PAMC28395]